MSAAELHERYERLRRRATEGRPGHRDGLAVLRQQGLQAWVASVALAAPGSLDDEPPRVRAPQPVATAGERSPLVSLCTDMLLAKLLPQEAQ